MSGDIILRDRNGVLLRYTDPSVRGPHHDARQVQPSDRERMRLIKAERELLTLQIIADHLGLSEIGQTRVADALEAIRLALQVKRRQYGMQTDTQMVAA
jgi:hypothetical protein